MNIDELANAIYEMKRNTGEGIVRDISVSSVIWDQLMNNPGIVQRHFDCQSRLFGMPISVNPFLPEGAWCEGYVDKAVIHLQNGELVTIPRG